MQICSIVRGLESMEYTAGVYTHVHSLISSMKRIWYNCVSSGTWVRQGIRMQIICLEFSLQLLYLSVSVRFTYSMYVWMLPCRGGYHEVHVPQCSVLHREVGGKVVCQVIGIPTWVGCTHWAYHLLHTGEKGNRWNTLTSLSVPS